MFKGLDLTASSQEILATIENNHSNAIQVKRNINELEELTRIAMAQKEEEKVGKFTTIMTGEPEEEEDPFEEEVAYYLEDYKNLPTDFIEQDLKDVLPVHRHSDFKSIILRLYAESLKEIKEILELLSIEDDESMKKELEDLLIHEKRKILGLKKALQPKIDNGDVIEEEEKNNIVLVPSKAGNIPILDDFEHIPSDFYPGFVELIDSVINGTFKGLKRFKNNNCLNGICEVKGFQIRILFQRLNHNTYALITAFLKKTDNGKEYQNFITSRVSSYKLLSDWLKRQLDNEEFQKVNASSIKQLFETIGYTEEEGKILQKGDDNV